jgi:predicted metal-dependent hydrolase
MVRETETIEVRDYHFNMNEQANIRWLNNDPVPTALLDGLSLCLPVGERFFIQSVKPYLKRLPEDLAADTRAFCLQEAFHTREHEAYNAGLRALGHDVNAMEARIDRKLPHKAPPIVRLTVTCAIEHLTATMAWVTLGHPKYYKNSDPRVTDFWQWHTLEEAEHRSVAHRIFTLATADLSSWRRLTLRLSIFMVVTRIMVGVILTNTTTLLRERGVWHWTMLFWDLPRALFIHPGMLRLGMGYYLSYLRPSYNPDRRNWESRLTHWKTYFAQKRSDLEKQE